ncbi:MAG: SMC-Scp complex subunit ScpB [Rhodospirillaceae bacterium TMED167]|nr:SMC-Scp complex subunit ScpB [Rhodospirillaceae bacterium]OUW26942.1 MAG: SMC-Scp complex subunit ScpB [Rhodospirillaceae bacterium TMED167]|tara:strand:+ start:262 stop:945 length:684 start_codon:yes stop_codon:yes gene_type:complete
MSDAVQLHLRLIEALLFASANPVPEPVMAERLPDDADIPALLETLQEHYKERGVNLVKVNKAWAFRTAPDLGPQLIVEREVTRKLSRAAIETLAIVAYHQPITRAEIEEVRGVGLSKGTMDVLFEAGWIRPRGRRRTPGKPVTWGTSDKFLDQFGLENLDDLPGMEDLKAAGLLDKRPAIQTLGTRGDLAPATPNDGAEDEDGDGDDVLPEPLDPDDGEISVPADMH